mmetsp:Transcript_9998/g.21127  ORF Transcript_9998/g.21127 Transcript_9998/m.21127 type:complete len:310 (-) Transcript_9998:122-1051(-)
MGRDRRRRRHNGSGSSGRSGHFISFLSFLLLLHSTLPHQSPRQIPIRTRSGSVHFLRTPRRVGKVATAIIETGRRGFRVVLVQRADDEVSGLVGRVGDVAFRRTRGKGGRRRGGTHHRRAPGAPPTPFTAAQLLRRLLDPGAKPKQDGLLLIRQSSLSVLFSRRPRNVDAVETSVIGVAAGESVEEADEIGREEAEGRHGGLVRPVPEGGSVGVQVEDAAPASGRVAARGIVRRIEQGRRDEGDEFDLGNGFVAGIRIGLEEVLGAGRQAGSRADGNSLLSTTTTMMADVGRNGGTRRGSQEKGKQHRY